MVVTLGQQYNIGEKPTVIRYTTYIINRHAGTPEKQRKQKHCSTSSNMVVIIYCYIIGCEDKVTISCCCCCCFSHSAHWLPTRKKLIYTVANPARGLLNREKKKKKSLAAHNIVLLQVHILENFGAQTKAAR